VGFEGAEEAHATVRCTPLAEGHLSACEHPRVDERD
jgi:hypothetical protein